MSRQTDLAIIDTALLTASAPPAASPDVAPGIDPYLAVETPELSEGQARYLEEQRKLRKEAEAERARLSKEQEAILQQQEALLGKEEADRLRAEQEEEARKSAIVKGVQGAARNVTSAVHTADMRIGAVPTPGTIWLPLLVLLILGFVLIQYNGASKLQWLWMALTNNAYIGGGSAPTTPVQMAETLTPTPQQANEPTPQQSLLLSVGTLTSRASSGIMEVY